ncbi:50S ribosomal protein L21, partial [Limosilactobacillus reuteri]
VVDGASVEGTVDKQGKEKKVVTFKYKPKKHTHTKQGHRQPYTKVTINKINA